MKHSDLAGHSMSRTLAALLGSVPVAFGVGIALVVALPAPLSMRYVAGMVAVFPAWVLSACLAFVAKSGARAWLRVGTAIALLAATCAIAVAAGCAPSPWQTLR